MTLLLMLLTTMTAWAQDPASIGSIQYNSTLGAYEINSVQNLNDLAVYVNGRGTYSDNTTTETTAHNCSGLTFKQTANITYTGTNNYTPIGLSVNDDGFQGTFDGQGNTISGIDCTGDGLTGEVELLGLFGRNQGTVRNVTLSGCRFASANNENFDNDAITVRIGSIAGINYRTGTISNCTVTGGTVSRTRTEYAETFETFIGGIAGENSGSITDCTYSGSVSGTYSGSNINMGCTFHIGGIVGINKNGGSITGCGSDAAVSCSAPNVSGPSLSVGGIAGANNGAHGDTTVSGCFFSGTLSGTGKTGGSTSYIYIGAFVGKSINSSIVTNNYYYGDYTATIGDQSSTKSPVNLVRVYQLTGNSITATAPQGSGTTFKGVSYFKADATVTLGYTGEVPTGCGMRYSYNDGSEDHDVSGKTFEMPANDVTVTAKTIQLSGTCGDYYHESEVTWEVTDTDGDGTYETLTISGTGAMKNYTSNNPAPWAVFKSDITTAVIGDGVTRIGGNAFYNFTALTSVTIAPSVTTIGNAVFFECTNLATINGASGVTYVDSSAFDETAWKNALPDVLTCVGHVAYLFKGDDTSVNLDAATTQIYEYCFQDSKITSIVIPASVERIGDYAFANSALQKMYVLRSGSNSTEITQLGNEAFSEYRDDLVIVVPTAAYSTYSSHWYSYNSKLQRGYNITCNEGITATSYAPIVAQGETVTLSGTGTIPDGYAFAGYSVTKDGTNPAETVTVTEASGVYSFTMPASDVTVSATWEPANKITVTANKVGSNYWTTFYCGEAGYRIEDDEEAYAYTATVNNSTVTLHLLGKVIPRGTPAIIIGEDNSISMNRDDVSIAEFSVDNDLKGVDVRTLKSTLDNTGTGTFYVLGSTTENGFGFHKYNADYMPARKAYLLLDGGVAQASSLTMVFDNETMEIKTTDFTDYTDKADTWYSLDGRKLDKQPTKAGVYINGSRKVVIK